jgi:hypothetical protein
MGPDGSWSRLQGISESSGIGLIHQVSDLIRAEPGDLLGFSSGTWLATGDPAAEDQGDDPTTDRLAVGPRWAPQDPAA